MTDPTPPICAACFDPPLSDTALSRRYYGSLIKEQEKIIAFLDHETAKIDALIAKVREGIEKLKECRTALISAAVTGKIDVRRGIRGQASTSRLSWRWTGREVKSSG